MRVLGIDFGEKRIGLAISDPRADLALPLTTIRRTSDRDAIEQIQRIVREEQVSHVVVGEPRGLDGSRGSAAVRAERFATKLEERIGITCDLIDEALTSVEAEERLRQAGVDIRRYPERVDAVAAQILLQQYLSHRKRVNGASS